MPILCQVLGEALKITKVNDISWIQNWRSSIHQEHLLSTFSLMVSNNTKCLSQTGFLDFTLTCEVPLLPPCLCSSCSFYREQLPLIFLPSEINISFRSHLFSKSRPNAFFLFWIPIGFCDSTPLWSQEVEKHGWKCFHNRKVFSEVVIARAYFLGKDTINAFLYSSIYSFSSDLCEKKKAWAPRGHEASARGVVHIDAYPGFWTDLALLVCSIVAPGGTCWRGSGLAEGGAGYVIPVYSEGTVSCRTHLMPTQLHDGSLPEGPSQQGSQ